MTTFVDTSAIFALLDADDANHQAAAAWFRNSAPADDLVSHNYVIVEAAALVHRRLGARASRTLFEGLLPAISLVFVDPTLHAAAVRGWLSAAGRRSSLVDWVSFELMQRRAVDQAFAFDEDFAKEGFTVVPGDS